MIQSVLLLLTALFTSASAFAATETMGPLHVAGDKSYYDSRNNKMELIGHAAIHQNGESLFADHITYERDTKLVHAIGNAVYVGKTALLQGAEMHFNLETRTGTIVAGRVSTDQFTLSGERINKLGIGRFQAHNADYTTCKDCPQSWTLSAEDVDLELEGYAYLSNVTARVMDAPGLWIPYLIVPIKTKRQTGLLMPQFGFTNEGFTYVQPFFWAISRSFDMTFGAGNYGGRGRRLEWEGRYALTHGKGTFNLYSLDDQTFREYLENNKFTNNAQGFSGSRWALHAEQIQELPLGITEKFRAVDVSDSLYLTKVLGDVPGNGEAYLTSDVSLSHATDQVSAWVAARRFRNLVTPLTSDPRNFDPNTVQVFPQAEVTSNDKLFFDNNLVGGISLGATNFQRSASFFDDDPFTPRKPGDPAFRPGYDPIREATRAELHPSLYTTLRPFDTLSVIPRANFYQYFYDFNGKYDSGERIPNLSRGYLHLDVDISTQIERVFDRDPKSEFPKVKHLIRPILNYSVIPYYALPSHPFTQQIEYAQRNNFTGYNFDDSDIVPLDSSLNNANYFAPEGNALSYGFTTQLVRKRRTSRLDTSGTASNSAFTNPSSKLGTSAAPSAPSYSYDEPLEWSAGQSFNFRELRDKPLTDPDRQKKPLSRFYSLMTANFDKVNGYFDYYYIPYQPVTDDTSRHVISLGGNWILAKGRAGKVLAFERSFGMSYFFNRSAQQAHAQSIRLSSVYSINDYIMPGVSVQYNLLGSRWTEADTTLTFQSPSECWKLDMGYFQGICPKVKPSDSGWCGSFRMNFSLNLTGSGFGNFNDPKAMGAGTPAGNAANIEKTSTDSNGDLSL